MSKKPSAETRVRSIKVELRGAHRASRANLELANAARREAFILRGQVTKAQQDAAEWRKRFDDLLARVPLRSIETTCGTTVG